ncbi:pyridoxine-5'-phosphate oxidase-like [Babylonia areolata]|uniref:pyridoxine-5'-phosphate oxidase-like n=1 Tax=Babylonia areolata TaxID=304850 RepID=UPI003FD33039
MANFTCDRDGRHPYDKERGTFDVEDLTVKEPFQQFQLWLEEAIQIHGIEANCMSLATATKDGLPSVRLMLMKSFSKEGFIFFTNYDSRKAKELEENPQCSLMFYWEALKKSVRIEGTVMRIPEEESEKYFHSRPRESQIGAVVSHQSAIIPSREALDKKNENLKLRYADESIPVPRPHWGGYRMIPDSFEFWYGHRNRLHDRLRFRRPQKGEVINRDLTMEAEDGWLLERLAP